MQLPRKSNSPKLAPYDVNDELNTIFGIPEQNLLTQIASRAIARWRGAATPNHPLTTKGQDFYSESIVSSRELLKPFGFVAWSKNNVELIINKEKGVAIYCCRGCDQTGLLEGRPSTLRPKGGFTVELLGLQETKNASNLELFPKARATSPLDWDVWILLTYVELSGENPTVRVELSRPKSHYRGVINSFGSRIILDTTTRDLVQETSHEESFSPDIDFDLPEKQVS